MKHLLISAALFALIILIVILDSYFLGNESEHLIDEIKKISLNEADFSDDNNLAIVDSVCNEWENNKTLFDISINKNLFDLAKENFIGLKEYAKSNNYSDFLRTVKLLEDTMYRIKDMTEVSLESVF